MTPSYYVVTSAPAGDGYDVTFTGYLQGRVVATYTVNVPYANLQAAMAELPTELNFATTM